MKKNIYMTPDTTTTALTPMQMLVFSGGGNDVNVNGNEDYSGGPNRSPYHMFDTWEEEVEEEEDIWM